jgi:hypothetical protein
MISFALVVAALLVGFLLGSRAGSRYARGQLAREFEELTRIEGPPPS